MTNNGLGMGRECSVNVHSLLCEGGREQLPLKTTRRQSSSSWSRSLLPEELGPVSRPMRVTGCDAVVLGNQD